VAASNDEPCGIWCLTHSNSNYRKSFNMANLIGNNRIQAEQKNNEKKPVEITKDQTDES
jgi:hypothetical protein